MPRAWVSAAAAVLLLQAGCGSAPASPIEVSGTVAASGMEVTLQGVTLSDHPLRYRMSAPDTHCAVYTLEVRAIDGRRHELRPSDFESGGSPPVSAVAHCDGPQLEPTWVDQERRLVQLTILEGAGAPAPLQWRPR